MKKTVRIHFTDTLFDPGKCIYNDIYKILQERYEVVLDKERPDFLFYDVFGDGYKKYDDCVKVFLPGEDTIPNFNECDYATGFAYLSFGDRYFHKNVHIEDITPDIQDRSFVDEKMLNRKFCNFIFSNEKQGEGAVLRTEFCKRLMQYKQVDCPGRVLNNMTAPELSDRYDESSWKSSKREFLKQYKFTIAFENDFSDGWTTEKLLDPLRSFSVPIYYGNPNVAKDFNPKSFINIADFDNDLDKLVRRVIELDNDDDAYLAMLREKPMQNDFDYENEDKFKDWLFAIIEKGNKPFIKDPRKFNADKKFWGKVGREYRKTHGMSVEKESFESFETDLDDFQAFLLDWKRKKYIWRCRRYRFLSHVTFGKMKKKYKEKYKKLKENMRTVK